MKIQSLLVLLLLLIGGETVAQNLLDTYFDQYADDERFSKVSISSKMFSLFSNIDSDDPDNQRLIETISKLKGLKMLIGEDIDNSRSILKSVNRKLTPKYEELMSIQDGSEELSFYVVESNGHIAELVMTAYENNSIILLSLFGEIDLNELAKLSGKIDIQGFDQLKNLNDQ